MQDYKSKIAELESSNARISYDLAEFKAESKGLRNQDLSIKRLEAQLAQMKAQLQSKVSTCCNPSSIVHPHQTLVDCTSVESDRSKGKTRP